MRHVIGVDPHKRSATIEVLDETERVRAGGRFGMDRDGVRQLLAAGRRWSERVWAVEGCEGVGRSLAQRLIAAGEPVFDVPTKLSAQLRVFGTGQARKTDALDAHWVALAAARTTGLRRVQPEDETVALRLLVDRRDELGVARAVTVNRLHRLLGELIPGGAPPQLSAARAKKLLATVRPRDLVGRTRRRLAAELIAELVGIDNRITTADRELTELVRSTGSGLLGLHGIGSSGAARLLGDIGDIARFPTRDHFASWNGTAPIEASSGDQRRHRLSRAGNRRITRVLHIMAIVQLRSDTEGRDYYRRKRAAGKTSKEALRALKRKLSDLVYRQLLADQKQLRSTAAAAAAAHDGGHHETGPGGHVGATTGSSAVDSNPGIDASEKSLPGPAEPDATPAKQPPRPHPARSRRPDSAPTRSRGQAQTA